MDIQTIKDVITILGFVVLIWNQNKSSQKETEDRTTNWVKVNLKLDTLCQSNTDIKDELRDMKKDSVDIRNRVSVLEEQIKVCNHRLEDLESNN